MKKLYMVLLAMVMTTMFVISPVYATEKAEAATATYTTEKDSEKIYFPLTNVWTASLTLPMNYKSGDMGGKNFYYIGAPSVGLNYGESYKLEFDKTIVNAKKVKDEYGRTHIVVAPKKKGSTTLKVVVYKTGFNKVTFTTKIKVTDKSLDWNDVSVKDIYKIEFNSTKKGNLPEYTKLFLFEINKERTSILLSDRYTTAYELKVAEETIKLLSGTTNKTTTLPILTVDEKVQEIADKRAKQLAKTGKLDNHEGLEEILDESGDEYGDISLGEVIVGPVKSFKNPVELVKVYKNSPLHWAQLMYAKNVHIGVSCLKADNGQLLNVTNPASHATDEVWSKVLELDKKYEYLMTPEEREYYGVDDLYDEDYEEFIDEYEWSI